MRESAEIEAVVRRFLASRMANDMEAMRSLHSESEYLRLIGSDEWQWFQGEDAVLPTGGGSEMVSTEDGPRGNRAAEFQSVDSEILRLEAYEDGDFGWAAVEQKRTLVGGREIVLRITLVLRLEASVWKLIQIHFSMPVPDVELLDVNLTTTLSDLLEAVDNESGQSAMQNSGFSTATVVFTDVVDSTALSQSMGDRRWSELISKHFDDLKTIVENEKGLLVKTLGDGGMYVFPSATSALHAAEAIQRSVSSADDQSLKLRIGVHSGDVVPSQNDYLGITVNKAARVAAAAEADQILASSTTADMVNATEFEFGEPITAELKGIEGLHTLRPLHWRTD
jgi:class 3 adenylate cyclase